MHTLVAASYNVHRCVGLDGRQSAERVARVLNEIEADVVVLQEVECGGGLFGRGQLGDIAHHTRMTPIPGPIDERKRRGFGNALLTRIPVGEVRNHNLAVPGMFREARAALDVDLLTSVGIVRVIGTHLGLSIDERRQQGEQLCSILGEDPFHLTLLLGDFNVWRQAEGCVQVLQRRLGEVFDRPRTFPARLPALALDRVWCQPRSALLHVRSHDNPLARLASDHLPLVAAIQLA